MGDRLGYQTWPFSKKDSDPSKTTISRSTMKDSRKSVSCTNFITDAPIQFIPCFYTSAQSIAEKKSYIIGVTETWANDNVS